MIQIQEEFQILVSFELLIEVESCSNVSIRETSCKSSNSFEGDRNIDCSGCEVFEITASYKIRRSVSLNILNVTDSNLNFDEKFQIL